MPAFRPASAPCRALIAAVALSFSWCGATRAETADRAKPLNVAADRQGTVDLAKQVVVFSGNVVITKGSIAIRADRVEVREAADGYRTAVAFGSTARPATFRQKREGVDEYIDGQADRLEYEDRTDVVRFVDNAIVRRLRGAVVADEITGRLITYNNITEVFDVSGANGTSTAAAASSAETGGRVRAVLTPREGTAAAEAARQAASASAPALQATPQLGEGR